MDGIVKWFAIPLVLTVVWMLALVVNESGLLEKVPPAVKRGLKIAIGVGLTLLIVTLWVVRQRNAG